jgi:hypothetical protein
MTKKDGGRGESLQKLLLALSPFLLFGLLLILDWLFRRRG